MFITVDIIQRRGPEHLVEFIKIYPNGAEAIEVLQNKKIANEFLHWCYQYLDFNEQEVAAYLNRMEVISSQGVFESERISNSEIVSESFGVYNSERVYGSIEINNCTYIVDSEYIDNSEQIGASSFVDNCERIIGSKNITNSEEVYDSTYVVNSEGIYRGENIVDSNGIWHSENLTGCGFCANCKDLTNSLFCQGLNGGEYFLFNKQIDKTRFDMIAKQYKKYAPEFCLTEEWTDDFGNVPAARYDYRKHFEKVTEFFWAWVKTLPGYDPSIIYSITFNPRFLT